MNDNDPVTALSQRVNRLEKRTHIVTGLLVGVPAVVLMLGAAANQETQTEKTVVAEKFIVAGADGKERASLALVDGAPHLVLMDKDGRPRVRLAADSDGRGPALFLVNEEGETIATLRDSDKTGQLCLYADNEKPVVILGANGKNGIGFIEFHDGKGNFKSGQGGNALK